MILLTCSKCETSLKVKAEAAGRRIYCPRCRHVNAVPTPTATATVSFGQEPAEQATLPPIPQADPEATLPPAAHESATLPPNGHKDGTAAASATVASPAGYEILGELGRGGMGVVYKARQTKLQRTVALKMILGGGHASGADLDRFRTEAESIARLQHPNIVQIYEIGEWRPGGDNQPLPFFSLEYCSGGSLEKKLAGTPLPPREAAALVGKLAQAMQAAHDQGVIHRDLKPANILLQNADARSNGKDRPPKESGNSNLSLPPSEIPKITDFGLAKKLGEAGQTQSGSIMGTPSYMAPEQAGGKSKELGPACDIYALGAILYDCLTGRPPFRAATPLDTVLQVVSDEPVPPSQLNAKVPRDLETICLKCLQKEPGKRYATAADLAEDLACFQAGEPIAARPVGRLERTVKWAWRHPAVTALLVVSFLGAATVFAAMALSYLMVASALGVQTQALSNLEAEQGKTREALQREIDAAYVQRLARAHAEWKANDVGSARRLLDDCPLERRGWEWNYLQRLCHAERWTLTGHSGPVAAVAFADDGRRILSAEGVAQPLKMMDRGYIHPFPKARLLRSWDLKPPAPAEQGTLNPALAVVTFAAYSPDGRRVAVVGGEIPRCNQIRVLDSATGACLRAFDKHKFPITALAISRDGTRIASASFLEDVLVWDVRSGEVVQTLDRLHLPVSSLAFSLDGTKLAIAGVGAGLQVWGIRATEPWAELLSLKEDGGALAVAFSADGKRLAAGGEDRSVRLVNAETGKVEMVCSGHTTSVTAVLFSPDGRWIASATGSALLGGGSAELKLWDAATGKEHLALRGHTGGINAMAFSPDGRLLASAGEDSAVRIWDTTTNQEVRTVGTGLADVVDLAASADGQRLAVVCTGTRQMMRRTNLLSAAFKLWDASTGKQLGPFTGTKHRLVGSICFSADGDHFATLGMSSNFKYSLQVWDTRTSKVIHNITSGEFGFSEPAFSPDGKLLAACVDKRTLLWDVKSATVVAELATGPGSLTPPLFSPDGKFLSVITHRSNMVWDTATGKEVIDCGVAAAGGSVSFSTDSKFFALGEKELIRVWDVATRQPIRTVAGHLLGFTPDGKSLAVAHKDHSIAVLDVAAGNELARLSGKTAFPMKVAFSPDGKSAAAWCLDNSVRVWDMGTGKVTHDYALGKDLQQVHFSADLQQFTVAPQSLGENQSGEIVVRSLATGKELSAFRIDGDRDNSFTAIKASADGRWLAALGRPQMADNTNAGMVALWDARRGQDLATFPALSFQPALALSPDGKRLAVAFSRQAKDFKPESSVQFWDPATNKKMHTLPGEPFAFRALAFSPDGRRLATADVMGMVKIWNVDRGQVECQWPTLGRPVTRLKFNPDGTRLGRVGEEGELRLWDIASASEVCSITQVGADFAFSPDGRRVAAASGSNLAKVWDANTGVLLLTLAGHGSAVQRVAFSPDGKRLVTGGADKTVRFWDAATGLELFTLRGHNESVVGLAFDEAGNHLITADENGTILIWDASPLAATGKN